MAAPGFSHVVGEAKAVVFFGRNQHFCLTLPHPSPEPNTTKIISVPLSTSLIVKSTIVVADL